MSFPAAAHHSIPLVLFNLDSYMLLWRMCYSIACITQSDSANLMRVCGGAHTASGWERGEGGASANKVFKLRTNYQNPD